MALIACKECGNQVSTEAKTCPKCGAGVPKPKASGLPLFILFMFLFVLVIIMLMQPRSPPRAPDGMEAYNAEIEKQAALCKSGHMEACQTELQLARLKQAAGK